MVCVYVCMYVRTYVSIYVGARYTSYVRMYRAVRYVGSICGWQRSSRTHVVIFSWVATRLGPNEAAQGLLHAFFAMAFIQKDFITRRDQEIETNKYGAQFILEN